MTEKDSEKILLTNALIYANGPAHIGNMVEYIQADIICRALKMMGREVLFCGAEDTHGAPIEIKASQLGMKPEEMIAQYAQEHMKNFKDYHIEYDSYYTTNSVENEELAQLIFSRLKNKGLIYKKNMELTYCEHDKRFLPDRYVKGQCPKCSAQDQYGDQCEKCGSAYKTVDLINPYCILCKNSPVRRNSEHYFFKLSEFSEKLKVWLNKNTELQPEIRNQILGWIDRGLEDWCVSRDGPYFGFKIPGEENKYFYVWLDAPIGYISSLAHHEGSVQKGLEYWNNSRIIHVIGKDIIYFHLLFWPAMLMGADLKLPENVLVHGFLVVNNEKMSKSRGTLLTAEEFQFFARPEHLRYYYASNLSRTMTDINLDMKDYVDRINNELVGNIANFAYRVTSFVNNHLESKLSKTENTDLILHVDKEVNAILDLYKRYELREVVKRINILAATGNKYMQDNEPWKLIHSEKEKVREIMTTCVNVLSRLIYVLKPILPEYSTAIERQLLQRTGTDIENCTIGRAHIIFQKIEPIELVKEEKKNIELRVAKIITIEKHPKAEKLYIEQIDLGDEKRTIVSGLVPWYTPEELDGKKIIIVSNLEPASLRGVESNGMLLAAEHDGLVEVVTSDKEIGEYLTEKSEIKIKLQDFTKHKLEIKDKSLYLDEKKISAHTEKLSVGKVK